MFVCLSNESFLRFFEDFVYVRNQITNSDKIYDEYGKYFLSQINGRDVRSIDEIVSSLSAVYPYAAREELRNDFIGLANELEKGGFVAIGKDEKETISRMPKFSYSLFNGKTLPKLDFIDSKFPNTADFFIPYFRKKPTLFSFHIDLTNRCNEKCIHCYFPNDRNLQDMPTAMVIDLLDQAFAENTLEVTFSGGECLLHKDFIPILEHARKRDFIITILSNTTLLDDSMINAIKAAKINLLQVSLYSMQAHEHDAITQVEGSHARTMRSIEALLEADIPVQISCPSMKTNWRSYPQVLRWAHENKIRSRTDFILTARTDHSTDNLNERLTREEVLELVKSMIESDAELKAKLDTDEYLPVRDTSEEAVCGAGITFMGVASDGEFFPCPSFLGYSLGNATQQTIHDVWHNSVPLQKLRNVTWKDFPKCMNCENRKYCNVCLVRNFNETGNILNICEHACDVALQSKEVLEMYQNAKTQYAV